MDLVRGMVERGHEVHVVCPWGPMAEAYFDAGAEVRIEQPQIDIDPLYIYRLFEFCKELKPDIFHAHQLKTVVNGLIAVKFYDFSRRGETASLTFEVKSAETSKVFPAVRESAAALPKIAHIHTPLSQWQIPEWKKQSNIFVNRLVSNWGADVVLALTKATREVRIKEEGIDPEKIVVIPNGVDVESIKYQVASIKEDFGERLGISEDTVLIGTLSRLTAEKGIGVLVEAVSKLSSYQIPNTKYQILISGSGELKDKLENQARERNVTDQINFLGFIPDEEKFAYLSALDVFVFPSLAEGFGISLIEAMACGCACLISDLPVLSEVGGEAVETFKVGDADDLAKQLSDLIPSPGRLEALGKAARARVEKEFTLEKFWERYERLYWSLLA